jgi:hypothetical protein
MGMVLVLLWNGYGWEWVWYGYGLDMVLDRDDFWCSFAKLCDL